MPKIPMSDATRDLIIAFLTRGDAAREARAESAPSAHVETRRTPHAVTPDAEAVYGRYCAPCHGAGGRADGPNAANLPVPPARHADPQYMSRRSDDRLFDAIFAGGYPLGRSATMPPYGETLTRTEIWALVRHLRSLCRCSGPNWSTDGERRPDRKR